MDELNVLVNEYYDAVLDNDTEKQDELLGRLEAVVASVLLLYGSRNLGFILDMFPVRPNNVSYTPNEEVVVQCSRDLQNVLEGLRERLNAELEKVRLANPEMSASEVVETVRKSQVWQAKRITESEDSILEQRAGLDIVSQVFVEQGYNVTKTWVAKIDARTCPICRAMNGVTIPFGDVFMIDGDEITIDSHYGDMANAHSNCRCHIEYNFE